MATATSTSLPRSIRQGLKQVEHRIRWLGFLRGIGLLAVVLAMGAAGGMALDFGWLLPGWMRWGLWLVWVGAGLMVLGKGVVRPLLKSWGRAELAALAEVGQEGLAERLVSAVELLGAGAEGHGSPDLIGALVEETEGRARGLDLARALEGRGAGRWFGGGVLAMAALVGPMIVWPDPLATLGQRFFMPWSGLERVDRFVITVEPGDAVAAVGSDVDFRAMVRLRFGGGRLPETAWLEWSDERGRSQRIAMAAESDESPAGRTFAYTLKGLAGTIDYRVVSGSSSSQTQRIRAVEPPAIAKFSARVEPPSYLKIPEFEASDPNRLNVWEGSRVSLSIKADQPLERASVQWPTASDESGRASSSQVELEPTEQGRAWSATLAAETSGMFTFSLQGPDGLASRPEMPRRLRVVVDQPPTVALGGTPGLLESEPDDILLVDVKASDDVAVASATLHYAITRADPKSDSEMTETGQVAAPLEGLGTRGAAGQAALGLKRLSLNSGDEVVYCVEVADNRPIPQGPNRTRSEPRRLRIAERAQPLLEQQGTAERGELREKLESLRRGAIANQEATAELRQNADAALRDNGQWTEEQAKGLSDVENKAGKIVEGLAELARDFRDSGRFAPLAQSARQIAEFEAEGARDSLEQAGRADNSAHRLAALRQADARQSALRDRLEALVRQFDERARREDDRRRLGLLAERQEELANRIEDLAREEDTADAIEQAQKQQEALRREVDELTRRSSELRDEVLTQQLQLAEILADRVGKLAESQREEARRSPESPERTEALADLARRQQAIESDARRLAMEVNSALRENGRGGLDTEAMARPVESLLRGETEPARQRIEEAEGLLRRLGRDLDEVRRDPKALARRLARRQRELQDQANQAIREARTPEARAALPEVIRALAGNQAAIAELAEEALPVPEPQQGHAHQAREATAQAAEALREGLAESLPSRLSEARSSLEALANALPDPNQKRNQVRQRLNQVRNELDQNGRELARHLQETAPKTDPAASARELAERVEPLLARQEEIAEKLATLDTDPESRTQRDRASRRAQALADALRAFREAVPEEPTEDESKPQEVAADWHLVGPFAKNMPPPFDIDGPINLKRAHKDKANRAAVWKAVYDEDGLIDLNKAYPNAGQDVSAYGFAEIESPADGPGRLVVGSDDTLLVWLNGQKVYDFQGNRSYDPKQAEVAVTFVEGTNRLVIRCGNGDGDWKFSVAPTPPPTGEQARRLALVEQFRKHLPLLQNGALAAIDRLREALDGRQPADELASELAEELEALEAKVTEAGDPKGQPPTPTAAEEARRIATALRSLNVPDTPASQMEAARLADHAARILERQGADPESEENGPSRAVSEASRAGKVLADRLAGSQEPGEQAAALAQSLRGRGEPGAPRDSGTVARVHEALADDLAWLTPDPTEARQHAEIAMAEAVALAGREARSTKADALADAQRDAAEAVEVLAQELQDQRSTAPDDHEEADGGPSPKEPPAGRVGEQADNEPVLERMPDDSELAIQPEHAEAARALARRERQLRQSLQALSADRAEPQEVLRDEAEALGRALAELRDEVRPLSPRSQSPASQASQLLQNQGAAAMTRAADQLAQGRPDTARDPQRQAADHTERAARAANDLVAALRDDLSDEARQAASNAPSDGQPASEGLAQARRSQEQAAAELAEALASAPSPSRSRPSVEAASASMREATQGLRSAASPGTRPRGRLAMPDPQGRPGGPAPLHRGAIPGEPTADPSANRNWGELPGYLREELLQASQSRYREDYARLIQLYFREIAGGSGSMVGSEP